MPRAGPDTFDDIVAAIYEVACEPALWSSLLTRIADHVGATGGVVVRHSDQPWTASGRLDERLTRLYLDRYSDNLYARHCAGAKPGMPYLANRLVDVRVIRRTEFHADILAPQNITEMVKVPYRQWCSARSSGGISFMMDRKGADRSDEVFGAVARLAPHLMRSLDLAGVVRHTDRDRDLEALLELSERPTLLCDAQHVVRFANRAAESLLQADDGLSVVRGADGALRLLPRRASDARTLAAALQSAVAPGRDGGSAGGAIRITRPSGRQPYLVCAAPLPRPADPWSKTTDACVIVFVVDPQARPSSRTASALQVGFGLTGAEARIAALIAQGAGVPSVARTGRVSQETVKRQLRQCFDKTGARSQAELARLVAMLPVNGLTSRDRRD